MHQVQRRNNGGMLDGTMIEVCERLIVFVHPDQGLLLVSQTHCAPQTGWRRWAFQGWHPEGFTTGPRDRARLFAPDLTVRRLMFATFLRLVAGTPQNPGIAAQA